MRTLLLILIVVLPCTGDAPASNLDSIASSTDDFLSLPKPPTTVPPAGSTGLLAPAAAAGPRFRPGSRVWCCPAGSEGGAPEEGTVGMVLSPAGGPGGQAVYTVGAAAASSACLGEALCMCLPCVAVQQALHRANLLAANHVQRQIYT
jgi:hypothetical protein